MKVGRLLVFLLILQFHAIAQKPEKIKIDVKNATLNEVLLELKEDYGFQFAFDKDLLSQYILTLNKTFFSEEETLLFLIKGLPLKVEKTGDVFLIIPHNEMAKNESENGNIRISGQVVEAMTYEPLPFSYILINNKSIQSDREGKFTWLASAGTSCNVRISHLGYFIYDTLVTGNLYQQFMLTPHIEQIAEVEVEGNPVEKTTLIGDSPGKMKLNHRIAPILPGYGDNSVFNLLRLMPGILAAGEQSSDLIIWGSYESHSKIVFDGFTLFGLKNFNDDIGVVNPLVLKDMEVFKGGYEAKYGDRVGGIVNITGKKGSLQKPSFTFNINNTTVNSMLELPVSKKSSLLAAYRQTYYELYDPAKLKLFNGRGKNSTGFDFTFVPDYHFRDANLKYSFQDENIDAEISLYGGGDNYSYNLEREMVNTLISRMEKETNQQWGGVVSVQLNAKNGNSGKVKVSYSSLINHLDEENKTTHLRTGTEMILKQGNDKNNVAQITVSEENRINFKNGHNLEFGAGLVSNHVLVKRESFLEAKMYSDTRLTRIFSYIQDNLPVAQSLEIKTGFRANYAPDLNKIYPEPRLAASVKVTNDIKLNFSWGLFHQFLAKTTLVDNSLNYYYFWANADNDDIPVLSAQHWVGGGSFNKNGYTASVETFYKKTDGLSRFVNGTNLITRGFYAGEGRSYGVDFFLKKEYKKHLAWLTYTLSKSEEHFPYNIRQYYHPSPQDQRHEIKFAGILNFNPFCFSASYVYGSGFERFVMTDDENPGSVPAYNRLDAALIYSFRPGRVKSQIGISVLNVLNAENVKLSNIRRIVADAENPFDVQAEAVPFTPTLFLNIKF